MKRAVTPKSTTGCLLPRLAALYSTRSQGICLQCRYQAAAAVQVGSLAPLSSTRRYASNFGAKGFNTLLKKWGKGPYKGLTEEQMAENEAQEHAAAREAASEAEEEPKGAEGAVYVPASTGLGLPRIGGKPRKVRLRQQGVRDGFRGYMRQKQLEPSLINEAVRRAMIEVYTLKEAGQPPMVSATLDDDRGLSAVESAVISRGRNGKVLIEWTDSDMRGALVQALTTPFSSSKHSSTDEKEDVLKSEAMSEDDVLAEGNMSPGENMTMEEAIQESQSATEARLDGKTRSLEEDIFEAEQEGVNGAVHDAETFPSVRSMTKDSVDHLADRLEAQVVEPEGSRNSCSKPARPWLDINFCDEDTKFAVLKRVMQLTGIRIPDPAIQDITSVQSLLEQLHEKPKPKKLAQALTVNEKLMNLANVQLFDRRYTPIDKEQELGRWKVIVDKLREKDLPIRGQMAPSEVEALAMTKENEWERDRLLRTLEA